MKKQLIKLITLLMAVIIITGINVSKEVYASEAATEDADASYLNYEFDTVSGTATVTGIKEGTVTVVDIPGAVIKDGITYTITKIASNAFLSNTNIISVNMPDTIIEVGNLVFMSCSNLAQIRLSNNITVISNGMFSGCKALGEIDIPDGVTVIEENAFAGCSSLTSIDIPTNVTEIGRGAFSNCAGITKIVIPQGISVVDEYWFYGCKSLSEVSIPANVTEIGSFAFYGCDALLDIELPQGLLTIGRESFAESGLTSIDIPESVKTIWWRAFYGCDALNTIKLPDGLEEVKGNQVLDPASAFKGCFNIEYNGSLEGAPWGAELLNKYVDGTLAYTDESKTTLVRCNPNATGEIIIPDSVVCIYGLAFCDCTSIEKLIVPDSVSFIGIDAFYGVKLVNYSGPFKDDIDAPWGALEIDTTPVPKIMTEGIFISGINRNEITAEHEVTTLGKKDIEYRWTAYNKTTQKEQVIQDWTLNNVGINWTPDCFGEYVITSEARIAGDTEIATASSDAFEFNPHIKGKCQMPYWGEGGGYLIGVESYENPNQSYQYEMLILDCTLLAEGKPAWVYTTNKFTVTEGAAGWCVWQPQYGYYWTLFRVYDAQGNMIDQACYPFVNAY